MRKKKSRELFILSRVIKDSILVRRLGTLHLSAYKWSLSSPAPPLPQSTVDSHSSYLATIFYNSVDKEGGAGKLNNDFWHQKTWAVFCHVSQGHFAKTVSQDVLNHFLRCANYLRIDKTRLNKETTCNNNNKRTLQQPHSQVRSNKDGYHSGTE